MKNIKKIGVFIVSLIILICVLCGMIATGGDKKESKAKSDRQTYTIADNSTASDNNTSKTDDGEGTEVTTKDKTGASTTTESTTGKTDSGKTDKTTETTTRATTRTTKESTTESTTKSTTRETTRETTTRTTRESTTESTTRATTRESTTEFTTRATTRENTTESTTRATTETTTEKKTEQTTKATTESTTEKTTKTTTEAATESTTKHTHNWIWKTHTETVHHEAVTHEEPIYDYDWSVPMSYVELPGQEGVWGQPVEVTKIHCGVCGKFYDSMDDFMYYDACGGSYGPQKVTVDVIPAEKIIVGYDTVVDKEAYDEVVEIKDYEYCSGCGQKK
ncbi:MAG: hypothetical protein K5865_01285 [Eubacterium sp.]|nr:hypothetical protein [Eubacterium sp.]